jgi:putative flippase GtrA
VENTTSSGHTGLLRRPLVQKLMRYSAASVAGAIVGLSSLAFFHSVLGWNAVVSNILSVTLGSIPNYLINRYWTWQRSGRDRMTIEATVFWVLALLGLLISTVFVNYADDRWGTTFALAVAQLCGFGVLWIGRFFFLDKVLFRVVTNLEDPHLHHTGSEAEHGQA